MQDRATAQGQPGRGRRNRRRDGSYLQWLQAGFDIEWSPRVSERQKVQQNVVVGRSVDESIGEDSRGVCRVAWTRADGTFTGAPRQAVVYEGHHDGRLDRRVWRGPTSDTQDCTVEVREILTDLQLRQVACVVKVLSFLWD